MKIVYLDTSFLSQLSQLVQGNIKATAEKIAWEKLLTELRKGVNNNALFCPASQFQTQEVLLAPGLMKEFISLQLELSKGLFVKDWEDILVYQAANQVLIYLKRPQDLDSTWKPYTREDPPIIFPKSTDKSKSEMKQFAKMKQDEGTPESFIEQYNAEKRNFLRESFLLPYFIFQGLPTMSKPSGSFEEIYNNSLLAKLMRVARIPLDQLPDVIEFFSTDLVDNIPLIRIHSSLYAQLRLNRKFKEGDWLDIIAMACVIPYCTIVTTDGRMKSLIEDQRDFIGKEFRYDIYTPSRVDLYRFIEDLGKF